MKSKTETIKSSLQKWTKTNTTAKHRMGLNEMPENIPVATRKKIAKAVLEMEFNRYAPSVIDKELLNDLARWYKCKNEQMLLSTGASTFARALLTYYGINRKGSIVIACPSFTYYERYCRFFNIPYKTWDLNDKFEYVPSELDNLQPDSLVLLASPNNPNGGVISKKDLRVLLQKHKTSLFVVDEAYAEFAGTTMLPMIEEFNNLIVLRTFSKAFCAAGIRCGALFSNPTLIEFLTPLQTPRALTQFTLSAVREILKSNKSSSWFINQIKTVVNERDLLYNNSKSVKSSKYIIYPSKGNFLLIKCLDAKSHQALMSSCEALSIATKDFDSLPRLRGCVRVTIGTAKQNNLFFKAFCQAAKTLNTT